MLQKLANDPSPVRDLFPLSHCPSSEFLIIFIHQENMVAKKQKKLYFKHTIFGEFNCTSGI